MSWAVKRKRRPQRKARKIKIQNPKTYKNPFWVSLPEGWAPLVNEIRETLGEAFPSVFPEGEEGTFCESLHPWREIITWSRIARVYRRTLEDMGPLDLPSKKILLGVLLTGEVESDHHVPAHVRKKLPKKMLLAVRDRAACEPAVVLDPTPLQAYATGLMVLNDAHEIYAWAKKRLEEEFQADSAEGFFGPLGWAASPPGESPALKRP